MHRQSTIARFTDVTKRFGKNVAVDRLDLDITQGEFVTLLGPSGCGKSTTLRMLGGFEMPDEGRILLAGEDVTRLPPNRRDVNMVFQDYALFPHMTVAGNVAFGLELQGHGRTAIDARVSELLELVQLGSFRDRMPDQLSGGQRQRVALARALAREPKLLLLDEPLGALDAKLRGQVQIELKALQQRTGKTFLFVTHDQEEALTMSDRIIVMNAGRIEQDGTPEELYHRPRSRFVADFIGETNLFACQVRGSENGQIVLDWNGILLHAAAGSPDGRTAVEAALRPESIRLTTGRPDQANALQMRIVRRVFKGSRIDLDLEAQDGDARLKASADPAAIEDLAGDKVWASWDPGRLAILQG
ncbi:MAG TPA: ABC transporter ATP-binding protein [Geminicoccus sp.]|uniref:ABC transporter ATP-binding protein n=1 Tax=Geminicoccus sp. TaxID=2024832 RepID=UPI002C3BE145|nr:ABC transporter ATP-binding protein [Geminicoccus sp.]HWL69885.1 ABC transporter ATP-binding protein [Geminicoccus sp.]